MAQNLLKNGHKLLVSDVVPEAVEELQSNGAEVGDNPSDIATKSNIVITMLPTRFVGHLLLLLEYI